MIIMAHLFTQTEREAPEKTDSFGCILAHCRDQGQGPASVWLPLQFAARAVKIQGRNQRYNAPSLGKTFGNGVEQGQSGFGVEGILACIDETVDVRGGGCCFIGAGALTVDDVTEGGSCIGNRAAVGHDAHLDLTNADIVKDFGPGAQENLRFETGLTQLLGD
jgi:hypothetical protein